MRTIASILALFFIPFTLVSLSAQQVTHDNNFMTLHQSFGTAGPASITVPPGEKKVLLVGISQFTHDVTNVDFAGMPMTMFMSQSNNTVIPGVTTEYSYYYLVLGNVTSPIAGNINITTNVPLADTRLEFAISFNNVDQTMPVSGFVTTSFPDGTASPATLSLSVPSAADDLVLDYVTGSRNPSYATGQDQIILGSIIRPGNFLNGLVSVKNGVAGNTSVSQTLSFSSTEGAFYSALSIKACPEAIPTLSQWGFAILGLMLMIVGVVVVKQSEVIKLV